MSRKEEIFQAILAIISEKGPGAVSTLEVSRRIGVSQPALYRHFKNRDDMILFFVGGLGERFDLILRETEKGSHPVEKIEILLSEHLELIERTGMLPRIVFSDLIHEGDPQKRKALATVIGDYRSGIARILQEGVEEGVVRNIDIDTAAGMVLGAILSSSLFWMLDGRESSLKEKASICMDYFKQTLFL